MEGIPNTPFTVAGAENTSEFGFNAGLRLNETWLTNVLEQGREAGSLRYEGSALGAARLLLGTLEGAMLVARSYGDPGRFEESAHQLLAQFTKA